MKNWNLWRCKSHSVEKKVFLTKSTGKTGYPHAKKKKSYQNPKNYNPYFMPFTKNTQNGSQM